MRRTEKDVYTAYGEDYIQFWIVDVERLDEWKGINYPDFRQALANANAPHFDPEADLRIPDPTGALYDAAVDAAWETLLYALEIRRSEEQNVMNFAV